MSTNKDTPYGIEPGNNRASDPVQPPHSDVARPAEVEPIAVEAEEARNNRPEGQKSVKDLDVCPNCGATMRGGDALVCVRCGFDLKTMQKVKTATGVPASADASAEPELLVKPAATDSWLPAAMVIVSGLILLVMHLAGSPAVFPLLVDQAKNGVVEIGFGDRIYGLLQLIVLIGMWTGCAVAALVFLAHMLGMRLGDPWIAAKRMVGIVATVRLASLIYLPPLWLEWTAEAIIQVAAFAGLSIAFFRIKPRDVPTLLGAAIVLFLMLWLIAHLIVWATA